MANYIIKDEHGIYHANLPTELTGPVAEEFMQEFLNTMNPAINYRLIINCLKLKAIPESEVKITFMSYLKQLRPAQPGDKTAIVIENTFYSLALQSILFVTGHNNNQKFFKNTTLAIEWLLSQK